MPKLPPSGTYHASMDSSIGVQLKVDLQTGEVIEATAMFGYPRFGKTAGQAALAGEI